MPSLQSWSLCILVCSTQGFLPHSDLARLSIPSRNSLQLERHAPNYENNFARNPISNDHYVRYASVLDENSNTMPNKNDSLRKRDIFNAACLVTGTAIGGGFLALPCVVQPIGFYTSFATLFVVWGYLLEQSCTLVEAILRFHEGKQNALQSDSEASSSGLLEVSSSVFGKRANTFVALLMTILLNSILVIQVSRAGLLFPKHYRLTCVTVVLGIFGIVFGTPQGISLASKSNSILTTLFCLSASALFGTGLQNADWSRLSASGSIGLSTILAAIPVFLYTMDYGETVPTVCELLKYKKRPIQIALTMGSLGTLGLMIGWAALATALTPIGAKSSIDPVSILLSTEGMVRFPLLSLSVTAILTTIIGVYLALVSSYKDILVTKIKGIREEALSFKTRINIGTLVVGPSLLVAASSPTIFRHAIAFSGKYPVSIMWGIIPPLMVLLQRRKEVSVSKKRLDTRFIRSIGLGLIAMTMLAGNIWNDLTPVVMKARLNIMN